MRKSTDLNLENYLQTSSLYRLGGLPTEGFHPKTADLSRLAHEDLPKAIQTLQEVDRDALMVLQGFGQEFSQVALAMQETLAAGKKIFLCGCGATGRLSLALESLWRASGGQDEVVAFMAGGDVALVRSVENFEDFPDYGARHLETLGFQDGDLFLGITEGGETPFVIGATERAAEFSQKPFFIFCNPKEILCKTVERSRQIIENPRVQCISIPVGPMALSGSTRLQASTVQMLGVGLALFSNLEKKELSAETFKNQVQEFQDFSATRNFLCLEKFIAKEAEIIKSGATVLYETNRYGITILTDTTERSPTFSLRPFENKFDVASSTEQSKKYSWAYLCLPQTEKTEEAWMQILGRLPHGLPWDEFAAKLSQKVCLGFDFSVHAREHRRVAQSLPFQISYTGNGLSFQLADLSETMDLSYQKKEVGLLFQHILLKQILNIHSLLMMGRLGRYEKNVMTWVRPSNGKLIDRTIRYIQYLLQGITVIPSYEQIAEKVFAAFAKTGDDQPVVMAVVNEILGKEK